MVLYRIIGWFYIESCYVSCLTIKPKRSSGLVKQGGIPLLLVYCALCQPIFRISHRLVARLQRWAVKSCLVVPACLCSVVCVGGGLVVSPRAWDVAPSSVSSRQNTMELVARCGAPPARLSFKYLLWCDVSSRIPRRRILVGLAIVFSRWTAWEAQVVIIKTCDARL